MAVPRRARQPKPISQNVGYPLDLLENSMNRLTNILTPDAGSRTQPSVRVICTMPWSVAGDIANVARFLLAIAWTLTWGTVRWIRFSCRLPGHFRPRNCRQDGFSWGRHSSPKPMICACGWVGPLRWVHHCYQGDGCGDVEPVDRCPRCHRADELEPVFTRRNGTWTS